MNSKQIYKVVGLMSGTSLDGIDIAFCTFTFNGAWSFTLEKTQTVQYSSAWLKKLKYAHSLTAEELMMLDVTYGKYLGIVCKNFIEENKIKNIDFISSHGHTVFHQPENGFTLQIGNGNAIHAVTALPVINDFRSLDVIRGGQGAPLVPVGDKLIFAEYDACLNLGGIANVSLDHKKERIAFDICFLNMGLNHLTQKIGKKFDASGVLASKGEVHTTMLRRLDKVYSKIKAKRPSLGREFFEKHIQSILDDNNISIHDRLRTFTESCAKEIVNVLAKTDKKKNVLCTGGGVFNSFLIFRMIELSADNATFIIPDNDIVNFKEALVFAFLGVLGVRDEYNCLKNVTGASQNSSSGVMTGF